MTFTLALIAFLVAAILIAIAILLLAGGAVRAGICRGAGSATRVLFTPVGELWRRPPAARVPLARPERATYWASQLRH